MKEKIYDCCQFDYSIEQCGRQGACKLGLCYCHYVEEPEKVCAFYMNPDMWDASIEHAVEICMKNHKYPRKEAENVVMYDSMKTTSERKRKELERMSAQSNG